MYKSYYLLHIVNELIRTKSVNKKATLPTIDPTSVMKNIKLITIKIS